MGLVANVATNGLNRSLAVDFTVKRAISSPPLCKIEVPLSQQIYPTDGSCKNSPHLCFAAFAAKLLMVCKIGIRREKGFVGIEQLKLLKPFWESSALHEAQSDLFWGFLPSDSALKKEKDI